MPDHLTKKQRKRAMQNVKLKNGSIERIVQLALRARGIKFRKHIQSLPGSPDIVYGDFWHGWRLPRWEHKLSPFWRTKLRTNRQRDQRNFRELRSQGWRVIRLWQHRIVRDIDGCMHLIIKSLRPEPRRRPRIHAAPHRGGNYREC